MVISRLFLYTTQIFSSSLNKQNQLTIPGHSCDCLGRLSREERVTCQNWFPVTQKDDNQVTGPHSKHKTRQLTRAPPRGRGLNTETLAGCRAATAA